MIAIPTTTSLAEALSPEGTSKDLAGCRTLRDSARGESLRLPRSDD